MSLDDMKHPKYVEGKKFYKLFNFKKIFDARALPRAHAQNILPPMQRKPGFLNFHSNVRLGALFCLIITQKANFLKKFEI